MKTKFLLIINIILLIACIMISACIFKNTAIFVDQYNLSPEVVLGGYVWLLMDWLRLGMLGLVLVISIVIFALSKKKNN